MDHKLFPGNEVSIDTCTFFDYLLDNTQVGAIFILTPEGFIKGISQGVQNSYGYRKEDLLDKHFSILFIEEDRLAKKPEKEVATVMEKGQAADFNYLVHKDGSHLWTSGESVFVKNSLGETYIVKYVQDVNQEKLLHEFLVASEQKQNLLSKIFNFVEHGIVLFRCVRNKEKKIIDFEYVTINKTTEKLLGRTKESITGKKMLEEYPDLEQTGTFDMQCKAMETGENQTIEFYYGFHGNSHWYKNKYIKIDEESLLITFDDITDQKNANIRLEETVKERTEDLQILNAELRNINKYLDKYAYVISHDLRAPLASVEALIFFLQEGYKDKPLDKEGLEFLDMIKTRIRDMKTIIEEVLRSAKREKKQIDQVDTYKLVQEIIETLHPPKHFHFLIQHSLPTLRYNRISLMQILQNILSNAIKFMDNENPIIRITVREQENFWLFCISDNGPGIPQEELENIFNPFISLDKTDRVESHGIGLSIVKQLVEENGGNIWAESKPGEETKFKFTIPVD